MSKDTDEFSRKWFVRCVGVFCGAMLGVAIAVVGLAFTGGAETGSMIAAAVLGTIVGGALGYGFPDFAEMLLRFATYFLRP
ncbi:hypothetical protein K227x_27530 [Rubripirellula lacrimiformis]|uniref:Uncharacterized protein n=1 Tax=Rubripirellula lacrimiformis TaxID=1930273 RepID=A0A517NB54_9BACT|nr:hypothetical protein [Rubripirellula lacrimiformis]QDT04362.1 hypothetical protein K227x_27530 [Rubripirellula lacrimiformis]